MTIDVGDEVQVKTRKDSVKVTRDVQVEELKKLLERKDFRAFIWRLMSDKCGLYNACTLDHAESQRQLGRRDVGLWLLRDLDQADSQAYPKIRDEAMRS